MNGGELPAVSVVVPTKDRSKLLRQCVASLTSQVGAHPMEILIVNDGTAPIPQDVASMDCVRVLEGQRRGPAAARNVGIAEAQGSTVAFTDDDTITDPGWLRAAIGALERDPELIGVVGRVESPACDPLREHTVSGAGMGNFLTCNAMYRRKALQSVGGFDEQFPYPHCEDRDLGYRLLAVGDVAYVDEMRVHHPAREVSMSEVIRRGRLVQSEWRLHLKHPHTRPPRWSIRWGPMIRMARHWRDLARDPSLRAVRNRSRLVLLASGQLGVALFTSLTKWRQESVGAAPQAPGLRIAWVGPVPSPGGGVSGVANLVLLGLLRRGVSVDCFITGPSDGLHLGELADHPNLRCILSDTGWRSDRFYSRTSVTKFITGNAAHFLGRRRLARLLLQSHAMTPYGAIYQFSAIELFGLRKRLKDLPPLVLHPEVHAAGEARWLQHERHLIASAGRSDRLRAWMVEKVFGFRSARQRTDIQLAPSVIAISRRFAAHLAADYDVPVDKFTVIPNPVEPSPSRQRLIEEGVVKILFAGRMSTRKGVDLMVDLSLRLGDLSGVVMIECIGDHSLWSDYRPMLLGLNPAVARYSGPLSHEQLTDVMRRSDLLVQPAKYEPFGLTVGEALAAGCPVVVTDEVGAGEGVDADCCFVVPAGDLDELERAVRRMVVVVRGPDQARIRALARSEAERLFSPEVVAAAIHGALARVAGTGRRPPAEC